MLEADVCKYRQSLAAMDRESLIETAVENYRRCGELSALLSEHDRGNHELFLQYDEMKKRLEGAIREIDILRRQNEHLTGVRNVQAQELYGRSSEKTSGIISAAASGSQPSDPLSEDSDATGNDHKKPVKISFESHPANKRGKEKGQKERILSSMPQCCVYEYDIDELNKKYGENNWRFAFWTAYDTIEVQKQCTYRKTTFVPVISYGLEHCMEAVPYEGRIMPKSLVSPSLLAFILEDLYGMHLPLYRQEHDPDRFGFPLSRQTMSNWVCYAAENQLEPVYDYLCSLLKACHYQQCDETTYLVVLEADHSKNFIWIHRTSEKMDTEPIIIYCYEPSRSADHLFSFYQENTGHTYLTSDAYGAYYSLMNHEPEKITVCGCFMHLRRRFVDAVSCIILINGTIDAETLNDHPAMIAVNMISQIYAAENPLGGLTADERLLRRQSDVKPLVDKLFEYIRSLDENDPLLGDKLKDAISYAKNNETALRQFLSDGNIPIDNGATERNVKPVSAHRNNSLFSFAERGAKASTIVMSLIETAKANGADSYLYLKYLLEEMSKGVIYNHPYRIEDMVPWCETYRVYEAKEKTLMALRSAPPGNERPRTPTKNKKPDKAA